MSNRIDKTWSQFSDQEQSLLLCLAPFCDSFYYDWGNIQDYFAPLSGLPGLGADLEERFYPLLEKGMDLGLMQKRPTDYAFMGLHPLFQYWLKREVATSEHRDLREKTGESFQQYYQEMAKDLYARFTSGEPGYYREAVAIMDWEYPNFLEAGRRGLDTGTLLLLITSVVGKYFSHRQQRREGIAYTLQLKRRMDAREEGADFSVYLALLDSIGNQYLHLRQPEEARRYFQEALDLCDRIEAPDDHILGYKSTLYNNLGACSSDRREQLDMQRKALSIAEQLGDERRAADIAYNISEAYFELRDLEQSMTFLRRALEVFQKRDDPFGQIKAYQSLSAHWQVQQNWEKAEEVLVIALAIARELDDAGAEGAVLQELASLKYISGKHEEAAAYHRATIPLFTQSGDTRQLANAYNLLSVLSFEAEEMADGLNYAERALALFDETGDQAQMAQTYLNIAIAIYKQGWYAEALTELEKATRLYESIGDRHSAERSLILRASALSELKQYGEARDICRRVMQFFTDRLDATEMINVARVARVVWEATGDKAFEREIREHLAILTDDRDDEDQDASIP